MQEGVEWDYFDKFQKIIDKYMSSNGEGETKASQVVTAVNKLIYKWYNDGDVFDNTHHLKGWWNDLSSYANWLYKNVFESKHILATIEEAETDAHYEYILKELAEKFLNEEFLQPLSQQEKVGSIYDCKGKFKYVDRSELYRETIASLEEIEFLAKSMKDSILKNVDINGEYDEIDETYISQNCRAIIESAELVESSYNEATEELEDYDDEEM